MGRESLTDASARVFGQLLQLESLSIKSCTSISAESMRCFANLTRLHRLNLSNTSISDEVLDSILERVTRLRQLSVAHAKLQIIPNIKRLVNLQVFDARHTSLDDSAIAYIPPLTGLVSLHLVYPPALSFLSLSLRFLHIWSKVCAR